VARNALLEASRRNAEAIAAMGMVGRIAKHWHELNRNFVATSGRASDVGGGLGAASKVLRLLLQSAILAVGAWLVINQQSTPGIIIAGSILGARALAPVDLAIANWRGFVTARQSWQRLSKLLAHLPPKADPMPLKPPSRSLVVQNGAVAPPGVQKVVCQEVNFTLAAGKALGVIGPTASGKSSLARMLVGVWRPLCGSMARRSINGRPKRSAGISATSPRTSNCSTVRWRKTSAVSRIRRTPMPSSQRPRRPAFTISSSSCRTAMTL
jgi:ATP-binding cassette subfamily C protein